MTDHAILVWNEAPSEVIVSNRTCWGTYHVRRFHTVGMYPGEEDKSSWGFVVVSLSGFVLHTIRDHLTRYSAMEAAESHAKVESAKLDKLCREITEMRRNY